MSSTNGFHLPSTTKPDHRSNDVTLDLSRTKERLKPKHTILTTINQTGSMKGPVKKQNIIGSSNNLCHKLHPPSARPLCPEPSAHSPEHGSSVAHATETHYRSVIDHDQTVSCHRCSAAIQLRRSNLLPSNGGVLAKTLYICENCQATPSTTRDQLIRPFVFDPKKSLHLNRLKTCPQNQSTSGQISLPTASNDSSSDKTDDTVVSHHSNKSSSASNLKRKRPDCSSPPSSSLTSSIAPPCLPDAQLDRLHRLCLSYQSEEFQGPSSLSPDSFSNERNCFTCRKSVAKNGPSLQCDYCPLIYHLECLTPPMITLPRSTEKWMCSNHYEPTFDRCFFEKKILSRSKRVKIYSPSAVGMPDVIAQDFTPFSRKKNDLLTKTMSNTRLEPIRISQIPKAIEDYYSNIHASEKQIDQPASDPLEEPTIQPCSLVYQPSSVYDPCVWDVLQDILDHLALGRVYEFSTTEHPSLPPETTISTRSLSNSANTTLDRLELLLAALNELQETSPLSASNADACSDTSVNIQPVSHRTSEPPSLPSNGSFSLMVDLTQFRLSHAALIDRHSEQVIYIRKHAIWFGSSPLNDICLNHFPACRYITERHACLYYDRKQNCFELLNYSEYGTIVNGLRYGLGMASNDNDDDDGRTFENHHGRALENENRDRCSCSTDALSQSAWDGAARIDQGTVIKIGCHEFLFYRHVVR